MEREIGSQRVGIIEGQHAGEEGTILQVREDRGVTEYWIKLDNGTDIVVQRASLEHRTMPREVGS